MPRNISFSVTPDQVIARTKTVTRRQRWQSLKAGTVLCGVRKAMGLKKGEKVERLCKIRVLDVRLEPLSYIDDADVAREGFPGESREWFMKLWIEAFGGDRSQTLTRIEFEYMEMDDA